MDKVPVSKLPMPVPAGTVKRKRVRVKPKEILSLEVLDEKVMNLSRAVDSLLQLKEAQLKQWDIEHKGVLEELAKMRSANLENLANLRTEIAVPVNKLSDDVKKIATAHNKLTREIKYRFRIHGLLHGTVEFVCIIGLIILFLGTN